MSSNKKATTIGLNLVVLNSLREEAKREQRSLSFIVEQALLEHWNRTGEKEVKEDAK